jgi:hypothetical protein
MLPAPRIEARTTLRALVAASQVLENRHLMSADPAENRRHIPLRSRPHLDRMPCQQLMAILAGIVDAATSHLDRDHIERRMIVDTACLRIDLCSSNLRTRTHLLHQNTSPAKQRAPKLSPGLSRVSKTTNLHQQPRLQLLKIGVTHSQLLAPVVIERPVLAIDRPQRRPQSIRVRNHQRMPLLRRKSG